MVDINLMQMMQGIKPEAPKLKPKLQEKSEDIEWEKEIDAYAESLADIAVRENTVENNLLTPEALKARLKEEFKEALLMKETKRSLEQAVEILNQEGTTYPNQEHWGFMALEFKEAVDRLKEESNKPDPDLDQTLQEKAHLTDGALGIIEEIA